MIIHTIYVIKLLISSTNARRVKNMNEYENNLAMYRKKYNYRIVFNNEHEKEEYNKDEKHTDNSKDEEHEDNSKDEEHEDNSKDKEHDDNSKDEDEDEDEDNSKDEDEVNTDEEHEGDEDNNKDEENEDDGDEDEEHEGDEDNKDEENEDDGDEDEENEDDGEDEENEENEDGDEDGDEDDRKKTASGVIDEPDDGDDGDDCDWIPSSQISKLSRKYKFTGYTLFFNKMSDYVKTNNPNFTLHETIKYIAAAWIHLPEKIKNTYRENAVKKNMKKDKVIKSKKPSFFESEKSKILENIMKSNNIKFKYSSQPTPGYIINLNINKV